MKILILEDEELAAERLVNLLLNYDKDIQILDCLDSVEDAVTWLSTKPSLDLIFMDIHLSDDISFEIFKKTTLNVPVIFTTAYDEYALQAFKVHSIDYLLKPIVTEELVQSLQKFKQLNFFAGQQEPALEDSMINRLIKSISKNYKSRFVVKYGNQLIFKNTHEIAYFYADGKEAYMVTMEQKKFLIDETLEELTELLDPYIYHRINRKFIIKADSIKEVRTIYNGKLKLLLHPKIDVEVIISREKAPLFRHWLNQ